MRTDQGYLFIFAVLVGVALGILFMQPSTVLESGDGSGYTPSIVPGGQQVVVEGNSSNVLPTIFRETKNSVVSVRSASGTEGSQGSGFFYDTQGHIVTNEHVVSGASRVFVTMLDGVQREAEIVGKDPHSDLAVLKVDPQGLDIQPLGLGDVDQVDVGEQTAAIGNPFGLSGTMTAGIVSQKDRLLRVEGQFSLPGVLQTDAAINPGNSGGPLLNMNGEVIGVNTAIQSRTGTFNGVGFAISADTVRRVVPQLIEEGEYRNPWIGVSGVDVDPSIRDEMGLDEASGFLIVDVTENSPADRAGLQGGDREVELMGRPVTVGGDVIVGIDGQKVRAIDDILNYLMTETDVGDTITLTVVRDGEEMKTDLTLDRRPQ